MADSWYSREKLLLAWKLLLVRERSFREAGLGESRVGGFRPAQLMSLPCNQDSIGQPQTCMTMVWCTSHSTRRASWPARRKAHINSRDAVVRGPLPVFERNDRVSNVHVPHRNPERCAKFSTLRIIVNFFENDRPPCRRLCACCLRALQRLAPGMQIELVRQRNGLVNALARIMDHHAGSLLVNDHVVRLINTLSRFNSKGRSHILRSRVPEMLTTALASDLFGRKEAVQQFALRCLSHGPNRLRAPLRVLKTLEDVQRQTPSRVSDWQ